MEKSEVLRCVHLGDEGGKEVFGKAFVKRNMCAENLILSRIVSQVQISKSTLILKTHWDS